MEMAKADLQIQKDTLLNVLDKVKRVETEKKQLAEDLAQIFEEAKEDGFNIKALKEVIRRENLKEKMDPLTEHSMDLYLSLVEEATIRE